MYQVLLPSCGRAITVQSVAVTAGSTALGTTFSSQTRVVRISANQNTLYIVGSGAQTAANSTSSYLPQRTIEYIKVNPGEQLATIQAPSGGADTAGTGTMWVTELTA